MKKVVKNLVCTFLLIGLIWLIDKYGFAISEVHDDTNRTDTMMDTIKNYTHDYSNTPSDESNMTFIDDVVDHTSWLGGEHGSYAFKERAACCRIISSVFGIPFDYTERNYELQPTTTPYVYRSYDMDRDDHALHFVTAGINIALTLNTRPGLGEDPDGWSYPGQKYRNMDAHNELGDQTFDVGVEYAQEYGSGTTGHPKVAVFTTGDTQYYETKEEDGENNALGYVLAELERNIGEFRPGDSYVNVAFWAIQYKNDGKLHSYDRVELPTNSADTTTDHWRETFAGINFSGMDDLVYDLYLDFCDAIDDLDDLLEAYQENAERSGNSLADLINSQREFYEEKLRITKDIQEARKRIAENEEAIEQAKRLYNQAVNNANRAIGTVGEIPLTGENAEKMSQLEAEIAEYENEIEIAEKQIEENNGKIKSLKDLVDIDNDDELGKNARVKAIDDEIAAEKKTKKEKEDERDTYQAHLNTIEGYESRAAACRAAGDMSGYNEWMSRANNYTPGKAACQRGIQNAKDAIEACEERIELLERMKKSEIEAFSSVNTMEYQLLIYNLEKENQTLEQSIARYKKEISYCEGDKAEIYKKVYEDYSNVVDSLNDVQNYADMIANLQNKIAGEYTQIKSLEKNLDKLQKEVEDAAKELGDAGDEQVDLEELVKQQEEFVDTLGLQLSEEIAKTNGKTENAQTLLQEALDFGDMWLTINHQYGGDYLESAKDLTTLDTKTGKDEHDYNTKVKVTYDAEQREYTLAKFKLAYLERYTLNEIGTQLCGMTGIPVLKARIDGKEVELEYEKDWWFEYDRRRLDIPDSLGRPIPSNYNEFPHDQEEFKIKVVYKEKMDKIISLTCYYRYLTSEGKYTLHQGKINVMKWECEAKTHICTNHSRCDHGSAHDSSVNHGSRRNPDYCCKGFHCTHAGGVQAWDDHYDYVDLYLNVTNTGKLLDIHDYAYCDTAARGYTGRMYGAGNNGMIQGGDPSKVFKWDIDLTTTIAGDAWLDIDMKDEEHPERDHINGLWEKEKDEKGVKNVGVTVYLYNGNKKIRKAIAYTNKRNDPVNYVNWPMYTDANGHYEVFRLEAPGATGLPNAFYVIEFEYDGQVMKNTVYVGDDNDGTSDLYMGTPTSYSKHSMAVETVHNRHVFDQTFGELTGKEVLTGSSTNGLTVDTDVDGTKGNNKATGNMNETINNTDKNLKYADDNSAPRDSTVYNAHTNEGKTKLTVDAKTVAYDNVSDPPDGYDTANTDPYYNQFRIMASTYYDDKKEPGENNTEDDHCKYDSLVPLDKITDKRQIQYPIPPAGRKYTYIMNKNPSDDDGLSQRYIDAYLLHINLGLLERTRSDVSVLQDLYKVNLIVNEQQTFLEYNNIGNGKAAEMIGYAGAKYNETYDTLLQLNTESGFAYKLDLYASDVGYSAKARYKNAISQVRTIKDGTEMRAFATYVTRVYNQSVTNDVELNILSDYYDPTFTLVQTPGDDPIMDKETYIGLEDRKGSDDDGIWVSIINENMTRDKKKVADTPYYRIIKSEKLLPWEPTRKENLNHPEVLYSGDIRWKGNGYDQTLDMKYSETDSLEGIKLHVGEYVEIFTTYEIDYRQRPTEKTEGGYKAVTKAETSTAVGLRKNLLGEKYNVAEVKNYSTYYTARDDRRHIYESFLPVLGATNDPRENRLLGSNQTPQWVSGRVDRNSAPNNIIRTSKSNLLNRSNYEDDTYQSNVLKLQFADNERDMYGYVFEDKKEVEVDYDAHKDPVLVGNGKYDSDASGSETLVHNVKVSMYEVINLDTVSSSEFAGYEYYYEVPSAYYNLGSAKTGVNGTGAVYTSNSEVKNVDGDDIKGNYYLYGYLAGDYVIRFDYGTREDSKGTIYTTGLDGKTKVSPNTPIIKYNGQDYENTCYLNAEIEEVDFDDPEMKIPVTAHTTTKSRINDKFLNLRLEKESSNGIDAIIEQDDAEAFNVARDNESRRMVVDAYSRTIENDRAEILRDRIAPPLGDSNEFTDSTAMFAETPIMQIEITEPMQMSVDDNVANKKIVEADQGRTDLELQEKGETTGQDYVVEKAVNFTYEARYTIKNINFGLEKRAETDIRLEQYVKKIYITKDDRELLMVELNDDGTINKEANNAYLNKMRYINHSQTAALNGSLQQGFYSIDIEKEFLNGLNFEIIYKIRVFNESEVDFTGYLSKYYIPREIIKAASITPSVEALELGKTSNMIDTLENNMRLEETGYGISTNSTIRELLKLRGQGKGITYNDHVYKIITATGGSIENIDDVSYNDTLRPNVITYGSYVGRFYYENFEDEQEATYTSINYDYNYYKPQDFWYASNKIVKTTVDQLVDYIDVNADYEESYVGTEQYSWKDSAGIKVARQNNASIAENSRDRVTDESLIGLISKYSFRNVYNAAGSTINKTSSIYDEREKSLLTDLRSNVCLSRADALEKLDTLSGYSNAMVIYPTYLETRQKETGRVQYEPEHFYQTRNGNSDLTQELMPNKYYEEPEPKGVIYIATSRKTSSDNDEANDLRFDNLAEILVYSGPTGRRDENSVPGNAMTIVGNTVIPAGYTTPAPAGMWYAGYNSIGYWKDGVSLADWSDLATHWTDIPENDQWSPEYISILPPTGITTRTYFAKVILPNTILTVILIVMIGLFGYKQIKMRKVHGDVIKKKEKKD